MDRIQLSRTTFRDKVYACWLGKNIGGTLGTPWESTKFVNNLDFFRPVPTRPLPNDDLDLQLVWLQMLEERGVPPILPHFTEYWNRYLLAYPWNEYGFCARNLGRGLRPPVSGWFENYFVDEMGSPIRSEIWACVAPADPQQAAALAWMDSAMDHAGGEGTWGEMFWAAVESAAFIMRDPRELIRLGLGMISPASNISRVIREAVWCRDNQKSWAEARDRIVGIYGNNRACNAIQNHGFIILGWLYGADFGDQLCKAVNCGCDTDCTGATLGSVLGIIGGTAGIPQRWSDPVGKSIVLHKFTGKIKTPKTIDELTDRIVALAERYAARPGRGVSFGEREHIPANVQNLLERNTTASQASGQDIRAAVALDRDVEIILHYHGDPVLYPGISRRLSVSLRRNGAPVRGRVRLKVPSGWQAIPDPADCSAWVVTPGEIHSDIDLAVMAVIGGQTRQARFRVLAPENAKGYPSAANIPMCPVCLGTPDHCLCPKRGRGKKS